MSKLQNVKGKVLFIEDLTKTVKHCRIEHIEPNAIEFEAGQYFTIIMSKEIRRAYSIGSSPENKNYVDTYVDISPGGPGSIFFMNLKAGDEVNYIIPMGKFTYEKGDSPILFASTGTGIVPFLAMIEFALNSGETRKIKLLQGVRFREDIFLEEKLEELAREFNNFSYDICLSKQDDWEGKKGRITNFIGEEIKTLGPQTLVFTCGAKYVVNDVIEESKKAGLTESSIKYEKY